jgi:hypothetical protein
MSYQTVQAATTAVRDICRLGLEKQAAARSIPLVSDLTATAENERAVVRAITNGAIPVAWIDFVLLKLDLAGNLLTAPTVAEVDAAITTAANGVGPVWSFLISTRG